MKAIYIIPSFRNFSPVNGNINIVSGINDLLDIEMLALDSDFDDTIIEKLEQKRIKFRILNCDGFLNIFRSYKKIEQIVYKNNIKVIFSSLLRPDLISYLLSRKKLCRISIARDFVDLQYFNNYNYITAKVFGYLHFKILKSMDYIIVISEEMKNHFINHGIDEDKILVTNNFLDEDMLKKMAYDSNTNGYVIPNINYNKIIFITSSILIKRKNIHSVLKIMKELSDEGFSFQYIILGDGEEKENLMSFCKNAKIDDKVFFLGFQENPWIYLNNADVYISASLSEGVSRSVMEALYFGKFCILSNIPGHFELIKVGENGLLFNSENDLKEQLKFVLINKEKFKEKKYNLLPYEFSKERNVALLRNFVQEKLIREMK